MQDLILNEKSNLVVNAYDRLSHTFITGYPSSGIATYVCKLIAQDIQSNTATILIDPYGDMSEKIMKDASEGDRAKIIHLKVGEASSAYSLNMLSDKSSNKDKVVETVVDLFYELYDPMRTGVVGPRFEQAIRMAVIAVLSDEEPSFEKLVRVFTDDKYVQSLLPKIANDSVKSYWLNLFKQTGGVGSSEIIDYVLSKLSLFTLHKQISTSINGGKSLDLVSLINSNKTIIFDLGEVTYDAKAYSVLGTIILHLVENAVLAKNKKVVLSLYVDEVQMLSTTKLKKIAMFAKRYGTTLTYITSRASTLLSDQETLSLMYECGRFGTKISFRQMRQDAENVEDVFIQDIQEKMDLMTLKRFHAYVQTLKDSEIQPLLIIET